MNAENFLVLWASLPTVAFCTSVVYILLLRRGILTAINPVIRYLPLIDDGADVLSFIRVYKNSGYILEDFKIKLKPAILNRDFFNNPNDIARIYYLLFDEKIPGTNVSALITKKIL